MLSLAAEEYHLAAIVDLEINQKCYEGPCNVYLFDLLMLHCHTCCTTHSQGNGPTHT